MSIADYRNEGIHSVFGLNLSLNISLKPGIKPSESRNSYKNKKPRQSFDYQGFNFVGMTGFEPATTRPPDAYSNRAELHPALFSCAKVHKKRQIQTILLKLFLQVEKNGYLRHITAN